MLIEFVLNDKNMQRLLDACKPVPAIALQCGPVINPQERANIVWAELGKEMGFKPMTVMRSSKGERYFTAEVDCPGIEIEYGVFSGCNQSSGDCPRCGR